VLISYGDEELWHERLLLAPTSGGSWVVLSPDEEMFEEEIAGADGVRFCNAARHLPRGIAASTSYRFDEPWFTKQGLDELVAEGSAMAQLLATRGDAPVPARPRRLHVKTSQGVADAAAAVATPAPDASAMVAQTGFWQWAGCLGLGSAAVRSGGWGLGRRFAWCILWL